jgi:tetratricopeptide (TPR) repeat protein
MRSRRFTLLRLMALLAVVLCLFGCYAGTVKPLLDKPDFQADNRPVRTLDILLFSDGTFTDAEIDQLLSASSQVAEKQVGLRFQTADRQMIRWGKEFNELHPMILRMAAETWQKRDRFDLAVAFSGYNVTEAGRLNLGAIDSTFLRYLLIRELDVNVFLHEVFHAFSLGHRETGMMKSVRPPYGNEWYWLTPDERTVVLRNKWRDFNVAPAIGEREERTLQEAAFYHAIGTSFAAKKNFGEAMSLFGKSLEANPKLVPSYIARGIIYMNTEDYDRAVSDLTKAIEINPKQSLPYYHRAQVFQKTRNYRRAVADYKKTIKMNAEFAPAYNNLAWLLSTVGAPDFHDGKGAVKLALKSCELSDWNEPGYLDTLAAAYARAGLFRKAVEWQKKALQFPSFEQKDEGRKRLALYEAGKVWTED